MSLRLSRVSLFGLSLGFYATLSQVVFLRELLVAGAGSEFYVGVGLFVWLVMVGAGALGARATRSGPVVLVSAAVAVLLLLPASLELVRQFRVIVPVPTGEPPRPGPMLLLCFAGVGVPALASGFLFTKGASLVAGDNGRITWLYVFEGIGALLAGLGFSFSSAILSHLAVLLCAGGLLLCGASLFLASRWRMLPLLFGVVAAGFALCPMVARWDAASVGRAFQRMDAPGVLLECRDTAYGRLCISDNEGQRQFYRDGQLVYAFPDPYTRVEPVFLALASHPHPRRVLVIGGGVPDRVAAAKTAGARMVTYLYQDPGEQAVLEASGWTLPPLQGGELETSDVRSYLRSHPGLFDAVLLFADIPLSVAANRIFTREFHKDLAGGLAPDGVLFMQVPGSANVLSSEGARLLGGTLATLRDVHRSVQVLPGTDTGFVASRVPMDLSAEGLTTRLRSRGEGLEYQLHIEDRLTPSRIFSVEQQLAAANGAVNTERAPGAFLAGLALRRQSHGTGSSRALFPWWFFHLVLGFMGLIPAVWFGWRRWRGSPRDSALSVRYAVFTTGMAAMVAQLVIIYSFSAQFGGLYNHLAWIVAGFMAGACVGAVLGQRWSKRAWAATASDGYVLGVMVALGVVSLGPEAMWLTGIWTVLSGIGAGAAFPVFLALSRRNADAPAAVAGIEAADHLGAALGTVVTTLAWLPLLGTTWTCILAGLCKLPLLMKKT